MGILAWKSERVQVILGGRGITEREELNLEEELSAAGQAIGSLPRKEAQKHGIAILIS